MKPRSCLAVVAAAHLILIVGCFGPVGPQPPKDRTPTFPVSGEVTIDGNPGAYVAIMFMPVADIARDEDESYSGGCGAQANADGKFVGNTYVAGDGIPAGEYVLIFDWPAPPGADPRQVALINRKYGRGNARKKEFVVKVEEGKSTDVGKLELKSK